MPITQLNLVHNKVIEIVTKGSMSFQKWVVVFSSRYFQTKQTTMSLNLYRKLIMTRELKKKLLQGIIVNP